MISLVPYNYIELCISALYTIPKCNGNPVTRRKQLFELLEMPLEQVEGILYWSFKRYILHDKSATLMLTNSIPWMKFKLNTIP